MKNLLIILSLLFCSSVSAEWVNYANSKDGYNKWFYETEVRKRGGNVFVWYGYKLISVIPNEPGKSWKSYSKINCDEYSIKSLQEIMYMDGNWTVPYPDKNQNTGEQPKEYIQPTTGAGILADRVCKK